MPDRPSAVQRFIAELRRRHVFRIAAGYAVVAFIVMQVADLLVPALLLPEWVYRAVVLLLILGFPVALVLAWAYDLTSEGIERTPSRREIADDAFAENSVPRTVANRRVLVYLGVGILVVIVGLGVTATLLSRGKNDPAATAGIEDAAGRDRSIAVLPFANLSAEEENEYFADGMTEEILTALSSVEDLRVISRTSVMSYKESPKRVGEIARELGVGTILEGSVRRAGGRVRITAQLVNAATDEHVWAQNYDRQLTAENLFDIQAEIAAEIARSLRARLSADERQRLSRRPTSDLVAYDLYLRGLKVIHGSAIEGPREALRLFREALERDPDFATAWALIAQAYGELHATTRNAAYRDSANHALARALEIEPELGEAHVARGALAMADQRYQEALAAFQEALRLEPSNANATGGIAWYYGERGDLAEAVRWFHRVIAVEPTNAVALAWLGYSYAGIGELERARATLEDALHFQPENLTAHEILGVVQLLRHDTAAVRARIRAIEDVAGNVPIAWRSMGDLALYIGDDAAARGYYERVIDAIESKQLAFGERAATVRPTLELATLDLRAGNAQRAERLLKEAEASANAMLAAGQRSPFTYGQLARVKGLRGDAAGAVQLLNEAMAQGHATFWITIGIDPAFARIREDPGFRAFLARVAARQQEMQRRIVAG